MTQEREDYMRRQEADHDLLRMRDPLHSAQARLCSINRTFPQHVGRVLRTSEWHLQQSDPCDEFDHERIRPREPVHGWDRAWYRGWEASWDSESWSWTGIGWVAYKGGCDLDAPCVSADTWASLLDAIDDEEE